MGKRLTWVAALASLSFVGCSSSSSSSSDGGSGTDSGSASSSGSSGGSSAEAGSSGGGSSGGSTSGSSGGSSTSGSSGGSSGSSSGSSGGGATLLATGVGTNIGALTVIGANLFWSNNNGTIETVASTGGTPKALVTDSTIAGSQLATDGTNLFFVRGAVGSQEVDSIHPDGSGQTTVASGFPAGAYVGAGLNGASEMFFQGGTLYIGSGSSGIYAVSMAAGDGGIALVEMASSGFQLIGVDATYLYTMAVGGAIDFAPLAGGTATSFGMGPTIYTQGLGNDLLTSGGSAYYILQSSGNSVLYKLTPPSATPTTVNTYTGFGNESEIIGDANGVYAGLSGNSGTGIAKVDLTTGAKTIFYVSPQGNLRIGAGVFTLDATNVYFVDGSNLYAKPR